MSRWIGRLRPAIGVSWASRCGGRRKPIFRASTEVRHGTAENRLTDPSRVTDAEVAWYLNEAVFLVSEDEVGVQGFACANPQTGYVWALFVIDEAQGRGHGTALLEHAINKLREAGHRQAFLTTGHGTRAARFYRSKGWRQTGTDLRGEAVFCLWL